MTNKKTQDNLATALCKAQSVMSGAKKDKKNPFFKSTYADLSSVFDAIRKPFAENGLSITQTMDVTESGQSLLCTRLMHESGEFVDSRMLLPMEPNPQKLGSLITYYRRYSLMAIAGIASEDDDGNKASETSYITKSQLQNLELLINGYDDLRQAIINKVGSLDKITEESYPAALKWVQDSIANRGSSND